METVALTSTHSLGSTTHLLLFWIQAEEGVLSSLVCGTPEAVGANWQAKCAAAQVLGPGSSGRAWRRTTGRP